MKLIMIEDDENKYRNIYKILEKNKIEVLLKKSYNSGLNEIMLNKYDFLILDMSLPTYDEYNGGEIKPFAGIDILKQLKRLNKDIKTIIITQFETFSVSKNSNKKISINELKIKLEKMKNENYIGIIFYDLTNDVWEKELLNFIGIGAVEKIENITTRR